MPPPAMFGWLCCGLCGENRKPPGGNLKLGAGPNRNDGAVGSKRKLSEGVGMGPIEPRDAADGWWWWCSDGGGDEEPGEGGEVPPSEMSESSVSLPGPGLRARPTRPLPAPDCCCCL